MIVKNRYSINLGDIRGKGIQLNNPKRKIIAGGLPYFGRVLSLDAVPYDKNPNQVIFTNAGVITSNGAYVYTQTGAPYMFSATGFVGPLTYSTQNNDYRNNFVQFDISDGKTGYFLGEWHEDNWTYFNTGNMTFINKIEVNENTFSNLNDIYIRQNSGDIIFNSSLENTRYIIKNENNGWNLIDNSNENNKVVYKNDNINIDSNGWYYEFVDTITLNNFSGRNSYNNPFENLPINGTYTRNEGGSVSFSNGTYNISLDEDRWVINAPNIIGEYGQTRFINYNSMDKYNPLENNWERSDYDLLLVGTASHTTGKYYPIKKTDGLLGIQYSGYFDNDPTWFNTASVKPIITRLTLTGAYEQANGTYISTNYLNQGTYRFDVVPDPELFNEGNYITFNPNNQIGGERYWVLYVIGLEMYWYKSYDLINWTDMEDNPEGAPKIESINTINSENSTYFGANRSVMNGTSWEWFGYFRPQNTSNHSFNMYADENAYFWIGDKALNGYTTGNADMFSSGYIQVSVTDLALVSGINYPVRIQWGHPTNPTNAGLNLSYNDGINSSTNFSGLFFNFTGTPIATNLNGYVYDFTLGEWQSTYTGYDPAPNAAYSHVWLDSISGFVNTGVVYSGNKHVTLVNNPVYSSDYSGVYSFNGINQYMLTQEVPQSADGSISYFIWFKPTGEGVIVSELGQPQLNANYHDSQIEINSAGQIYFGLYAYGGAVTSSPVNFDRWYHLGLTYASGTFKAYINGENIGAGNLSPHKPEHLYYGICAADSTNMGVGGYGQGYVGSFQVYNKALTTGEINSLYNNEKDRFPLINH